MLRHSYFETLVREPVPREADVYRLLVAFEIAVEMGKPMTFTTFKQLWQARHFSFIFEANNSPSLHQPFIQSLYAAAIDGLLRDLRPVIPPVRRCNQGTSQYQDSSVGTDTDTRQFDDSRGQDTVAAAAAVMVPAIQDGLVSPNTLAQLLESSDDEEALQHSSAAVAGSATPQMDNTAPPRCPATALGHDASQQQRQGPKVHCSQTDAIPDPKAGDAQRRMGSVPSGNVQHHAGSSEAIISDHPKEVSQLSPADKRARYAKAGQPGAGKRKQRPRPVPLKPDRATVPPSTPPGRAQAAAAVFALRCLHLAQPRSSGTLVRAYLPLPALHAISALVDSLAEDNLHEDVAAAMIAMRQEDAFVVGALMRPVTGSSEFLVAARPKKVVAAADVEGEATISRETKYHLYSTLQGMKGLQNVLHHQSRKYSATWEVVRATLGNSAAAAIPQLGAVRVGEQLGVLAREGAEGVKEALEGRGKQWHSKAAAAARHKARAAVMDTPTPQGAHTEGAANSVSEDDSDPELDAELMAGLSGFSDSESDGGGKSSGNGNAAKEAPNDVGRKRGHASVAAGTARNLRSLGPNTGGVTRSTQSRLGRQEAGLLAGLTGKARQIVQRDLEEQQRQKQAKEAWLSAQSLALQPHPGVATSPDGPKQRQTATADDNTANDNRTYTAPVPAASRQLPAASATQPQGPQQDITANGCPPIPAFPKGCHHPQEAEHKKRRQVNQQRGGKRPQKIGRLARSSSREQASSDKPAIGAKKAAVGAKKSAGGAKKPSTQAPRQGQQAATQVHKPPPARQKRSQQCQGDAAGSGSDARIPCGKVSAIQPPGSYSAEDAFDAAGWEAENAALIAAADAAMEAAAESD